jgi:hypothetical protein
LTVQFPGQLLLTFPLKDPLQGYSSSQILDPHGGLTFILHLGGVSASNLPWDK